ncbi:aspartate ammonia-lyase [Haliscomenobacter hydrossis]|uniref:Aspartate ammonia-lyase n=1 Tax=Haliscomenobacter hydrossis (strain ATCC 27775 / DSM 1100 / LMG 10767 / O) TaxID=760192 RepID=F4KXB2_HALH1|nr:aspartate ammonia-lyase [Haliscomenobacter hydrossis]AEE49320.1 aspartate ammonia-lyase [Haliscomenobacter hydrossis DSM 1100]
MAILTANPNLRLEHDLLGEKHLPIDAYYGIQTQRALENFKISGVTLQFFPEFIEGLVEVKKACALANYDLGALSDEVKNAIVAACDEIIAGKFHDQFKVDMIQGGAGTSTNMNANEVIANRALEIMGYKKGDYEHCHPNNHVNLSQSTNDAYPTALKIALIKCKAKLLVELVAITNSFRRKGEQYQHVIKMGRTQLQDAVPMTMGQTFEAYAVTLEEEIERLENNTNLFLEVNLGGTAIGTGINTSPNYARLAVAHLRDVTGLKVVKARNLIEATQDTGAFIMFSSAVKRLAIKLSKICHDLRLLSSGPRTGFNEINLPPMQPGSSIMPGKVNPVIPEVMNQIAFRVMGNDLTVNMAVEAGQLELNAFEPIIGHCLFESINILKNGMSTLRTKCIDGITVNEKRCWDLVKNSISIVTALNPALGYEVCSALSKEALATDRSIYDLVLEKNLMSQEQLDEVLSPENMIRPQLKANK